MTTKAMESRQPLPGAGGPSVLSIEEAAAILGFGRSKTYAEAKKWLATGGREGIPCRRFGRYLRVPTVLLAEMLETAS